MGEIARGLHPSWAEVDETMWRWPHFSAKELSCKCGGRYCRGQYFHNPDFLDGLEAVRGDMGRPLVLTSGRRCERHNKAVDGASRSQHTIAIAGDVSLMGHDAVALARSAIRAGFRGVGFGRSFLHLDWRATFTPFHYLDAEAHWRRLCGFDPVARLKAGGAL
ncbi:D-Ala-D-Ala carboxypeptidase family metallohydrolase [Brevundimonas aurantiaca]|uniref:D-Ala-D-Ala carboxypeptidase family metallohydrolase n=1 Tax=Brevundimonas aurantiaca TaxID=74316 RepID=UPI002FDD98C1